MPAAETSQPSIEDRVGNALWGDSGADDADDADTEVVDQAEDQADDSDDADASDDVQQSNAVEEVEVEVEGWKGKIPAKLKAELDKGADYTRKTQELAEQRRQIEAHHRLQTEAQQFQQSVAAEVDQLRQIDAQLEQYKRVDLSTIDSESLARMQMLAANLREDKAKLMETIQGKQGQFQQQVIQGWNEMTTRAQEIMRRSFSDWDQAAPKIAEYAIGAGFPVEVITGYDPATRQRVGPGVVDPAFATVLYKAWKLDQLQAKTASEKVARAAPMLKPGAADPRNSQQLAEARFRKAIKGARSDTQKAALLADRLAERLKF